VEGAGSRHLARARQALRAKIQFLLAPLVNRCATAPELARQHRQLPAVIEEGDPPSAETGSWAARRAPGGRPRPAATTDRGGT